MNFNQEKPPKGWSKRHWGIACAGVEMAVMVERERCARIADNLRDPRTGVTRPEGAAISQAIREGR
jgi:hypothetical protein